MPGVPVLPLETYPPLVVDTNAPPAFAVTLEHFQPDSVKKTQGGSMPPDKQRRQSLALMA
jgi:hypothetical protein